VGFAKVESEVLQRFDPARVSAITGVGSEDLERFAHMYARARAPSSVSARACPVRERCQAIRAVALPRRDGCLRLGGRWRAAHDGNGFGLDPSFIRKPSARPDADRESLASGQSALELTDRPSARCSWRPTTPPVTCPDVVTRGAGSRGKDLFTVVHDPFLSIPPGTQTSCCPRRPISRATTSYAPTARTTCSSSAVVRPRAGRGRMPARPGAGATPRARGSHLLHGPMGSSVSFSVGPDRPRSTWISRPARRPRGQAGAEARPPALHTRRRASSSSIRDAGRAGAARHARLGRRAARGRR